jgi:hypothetical protein
MSEKLSVEQSRKESLITSYKNRGVTFASTPAGQWLTATNGNLVFGYYQNNWPSSVITAVLE